MSLEHERLKRLFLAAIELPPGSSRTAFVAAAVAEHPELEGRLQSMLAAHDQPMDAIDQPLARLADEVSPFSSRQSPDAPADAATEQPGQILAGRYKLLESVGKGGMGSVWVADQLEPVRRRVAVKLIKAGMDTQQVMRRFEAERQALAIMDHPHIAKVLDGGMTDLGRPFFVMEFVKGVPITDYCDAARLSVAQRLELFIPVCQAVQHAHQKGILHRDLKPSNILVCLYDGRPVPKIIDFGLAKAMHQSLTDATVYTALGVLLGTPLYMSPEQAEINNLDIDTRSDVYSLGVLLYELLTGTTPLERQRFQRAAWDEMMRLIREVDPPKPSTRLSGSGSLPSVAAQRHVEPAALTRQLRGELDWIVMKCLEKDRGRRYESPSGLAEDIRHYLANELVTARPASPWYRWRKTLRRHRTAAIGAALFWLASVAGVITTSIAWREAERQRDQARLRLQQIESANAILTSIFDDLNPQTGELDDEPLRVQLASRLDQAADQLATGLAANDSTTARMQLALARAYRELGFPDRAGSLARKSQQAFSASRGAADRETLRAMSEIAASERDAGRTDVAERWYQEILQLRENHLGERDPDTLGTLMALGACRRERAQLESAIALLRQAAETQRLVLGDDHPDTITSLSELGLAYRDARQFDLAGDLMTRVLAAQRQRHGEEHLETWTAMNNLAVVFRDQGKHSESFALLNEIHRRKLDCLGANHPATLAAKNNLAGAYFQAGQVDVSISLYEELLRDKSRVLGDEHPSTHLTAANLGRNYQSAGRLADALPLLQRAQRASISNPALRWVEPHLAECLADSGRADEAVQLLTDLVSAAHRDLPAGSQELGDRLARLGWFLMVCNLEAYEAAEPPLRDALAIRRALAADHWTTFNASSVLGGALLGQNKLDAAAPLLLSGYEGMRDRREQIPAEAQNRLRDAIVRLRELHLAQGNSDQAQYWSAELNRFDAQ